MVEREGEAVLVLRDTEEDLAGVYERVFVLREGLYVRSGAEEEDREVPRGET